MIEYLAQHFEAPILPRGDTLETIPLEPSECIQEYGFFYPRNAVSVDRTQHLLDIAVKQEIGRRAEIGVVSQVLWWDGAFFTLGAFDPRSGLQVGLGQAIWDPDPRQREKKRKLIGYQTAFIVAKKYEGLGLGSIMRMHLESYMARHIDGLGVYLLSHIEATSQPSREAAISIMRKVGARPSRSPGMEGWFIKLVTKDQVPAIPKALMIQSIALERRTQAMLPPEGIIYRNKGFYVRDAKVAILKRGRLRLTGTLENIQQMFELWQAAKYAGFSIRLSL